MKMNVYVVMDRKASYFGTPFFMQTDPIAVRSFGDAVRDPKTSLNKHPEDYALYRIGFYDDQSAELVSEKPTCLVNASSFQEVVDLTQAPIDGKKEIKVH